MKPKFQFTLGGDLGTKSISEPQGWADIKLNLERDPSYYSVVENIEVTLIFYGSNGSVDGGYSYVKQARDNGINTRVTLDIEVTFDDAVYDTCFSGLLDLSTCKETVFRNKMEVAVLRNDVWSTFMNRKSIPIDIKSTTDLDGNARVSIPSQTLNLSAQRLIKRNNSDMQDPIGFYCADLTSGKYIQIDTDNNVLSELNTKFTLPNAINPSVPSSIYAFDEGGQYSFDFRIEASIYYRQYNGTDCHINRYYEVCDTYITFYFKKNDETPIAFTKTNSSLILANRSTTFTYSTTLDIKPNDEVSIYATIDTSFPYTNLNNTNFVIYSVNKSIDLEFDNTVVPIFPATACHWALGAGGTFEETITMVAPPSGATLPTYFNITGNTKTIDSTCDSMLLHDVGLAISDRILDADYSFYSEYFGGSATKIVYPSNGCGYLNTLTRGLNIRGYSFDDKPFTISMDDYLNGVDPMFNIGIGYDTISGRNVIRIEPKSHFFDDSSFSAVFEYVNNITVSFDLSVFYKTIEIGFDTWNAESIQGIDDPQTKHIYNTIFKTFGSDKKTLSKFVAASLAIEQTRRLGVVESQDWRLDENIFIIALQDINNPELFNHSPLPTTNLQNRDTRYNIRHTPARMLKRWLSLISNQLFDNLSSKFFFSSGEGNILMTWTGDTCDPDSMIENQDISPTSDYLYSPLVYQFNHPCTWDQYKTMRDNRHKAISISWQDPETTTVYTKTAFIKKVQYQINRSVADFEVWIK